MKLTNTLNQSASDLLRKPPKRKRTQLMSLQLIKNVKCWKFQESFEFLPPFRASEIPEYKKNTHMWPRKDVQRNFFYSPIIIADTFLGWVPGRDKGLGIQSLGLDPNDAKKETQIKRKSLNACNHHHHNKKCDILPFTRWEKWRLAWEKNRFSWNNNWDWFDVLNYQTHRAKTLLRNSCVSEGWFERERKKAHLIFFLKSTFQTYPLLKTALGEPWWIFSPISLPPILTPCFKIISKDILANKIK